MKTFFQFTLWFLSIAAFLVFSISLLSMASSLRDTAASAQASTLLITQELAQTRAQLNATLDRLPQVARDSSNKAVGGAIDAANPLRNLAQELKPVGKELEKGAQNIGKEAEKGAQNVKSEANEGLRRLGVPFRF